LRVDFVRKGDFEGVEGVYLINAADEITQFEFVGAVARISEVFLLPMLASMLEFFRFVIRGFHSDNGSECINYQVAKLLDKLHTEVTKSRSRNSNDNAFPRARTLQWYANTWATRTSPVTTPKPSRLSASSSSPLT